MAAPRPVHQPASRPLFKVRCTQSMPIGPIGAERITPIAKHPNIVDMINSIIVLHKMQFAKLVKKI